MTTDQWEPPDTYLRVWDRGNGMMLVDVADEPRVDAAVSMYIDSGGTRDTVLHLTTMEGNTYSTLASDVGAWSISTPETRRRNLLCQQRGTEEDKAVRHSLGMWDEGDT